MSLLVNESVRAGFSARLTASLTGLFHTYRRHQERRAGVKALEGMDDYLLQDLGISRSEIFAVVHGLHGSRRRGHDT